MGGLSRVSPACAAALLALAAASTGRAADRCQDLVHFEAPHTTIRSATPVAAGEFAGPDKVKQADLPAFCRVVASVRPAPDSDIEVEVWLPADRWTGVFHGNGNGGYGGRGLGGFGGRPGGQRGNGAPDRPDPGLAKVAAETGGGYFELTNTDDLASTFKRVADELHHQYLLGFSPAVLDGKTHRLGVLVKNEGLSVRARRTYLAARE